MKRSLAILLGITVLSGCGVNNADDEIYPDNGNALNYQLQGEDFNEDIDDDQFGFVRQVKSPVPNSGTTATEWMDREKVALAISQTLVSLPNVHDASVVVTDEEVLVAYTTDQEDEKSRFEVADQVKIATIGLLPRWYHVYITDDEAIRQDVINIGSMATNSPSRERNIEMVIEEMIKRSPQGRKLGPNENENGESLDEMNGHLDKANFHQQLEKKE